MTEIRELEDLRYLIRCAVHRHKADPARIRAMDLTRLYQISRFHSLAALSYTAVESAWDGHPPQDLLPAGWKEARDAAIRNSLLFAAERKALESFCEAKGIWYLPLKGAVLQKDYPGLGLREMADNDILYDAACQQQVYDWFVGRGYAAVEYRQGVHDTYHKPPVLNFEMHTALFEASTRPEWADYFRGAAARSLPMEGTRLGRRFTREDFYLYLLAHMYKHFAAGGTGIRSLLDVFIFRRAYGEELDQDVVRQGLEQLNLTDFDRQTCALAQKIFGCGDPLCEAEVEKLNYYLTSGTHGTVDHRVDKQLKKMAGTTQNITGKTKALYGFRRLFPDRAFMEMWCRHDAPFFLHHSGLMPLAYGYRLIYNLSHGKGRRLARELRFLWGH